jgi:hypothetical protein
VRPGIRTIAAAVLLFFGGIILVISGAVVYSGTSRLVSEGQGLDMLVIGAISKSCLITFVTILCDTFNSQSIMIL